MEDVTKTEDEAVVEVATFAAGLFSVEPQRALLPDGHRAEAQKTGPELHISSSCYTVKRGNRCGLLLHVLDSPGGTLV